MAAWGRLGQGLCEPSIGDNTFSIVDLSKKIVKLDKPIYAGLTIIDLYVKTLYVSFPVTCGRCPNAMPRIPMKRVMQRDGEKRG